MRRLKAELGKRFPQGSLGRRSMTAGIWSLAELGLGNILRLASNLILTRLLVPEAFGLMAMVTTVQIGVSMMSDLGIRQSVIRAHNAEDPEFLRTAWTVQIIRGTAIAAVVVLAGCGLLILGPLLATPGTVYSDPVLPWLVMVSALGVFTESLRSTNALVANRRLELGRLTLLHLSGQAFGTLLMVLLALQTASVWSLLAGGLAGTLLKTGLSHVVFGGPAMRPAWDQEIRRELWQFGRWLIGSSALSFVARHADRLILGALLPTSTLGLYMIGLLWVQAYSMAVIKLTSQIGLAALSEARREKSGLLPRLLRKSLRILDMICLTGFLFFVLLGPDFVGLLYSENYHAAGEFMPLLAVLILVQRFVIFSELLVAEGRSFDLLTSNAASAVAVCIAVPLGFSMLGTNGAIAGSIVAPLVGVAFRLRAFASWDSYSFRQDWIWLGVIALLPAGVILLSAAL